MDSESGEIGKILDSKFQVYTDPNNLLLAEEPLLSKEDLRKRILSRLTKASEYIQNLNIRGNQKPIEIFTPKNKI